MLAELRAAGFHVTEDRGTLYIDPASRLTDEQRARVRRHKPAILRELAAEADTTNKARESAAKHAGPGLSDFRAALALGRLHVCCNCRQFEFAADPTALGHCRRFHVETWPFVPFWCVGFTSSTTPAAPEFLPDPADGARIRASEYAK